MRYRIVTSFQWESRHRHLNTVDRMGVVMKRLLWMLGMEASFTAFTPDGRLALSGCYDHTVMVWEIFAE